MKKSKKWPKVLARLLTCALLLGVLTQSAAATAMNVNGASATGQYVQTSIGDSRKKAAGMRPDVLPAQNKGGGADAGAHVHCTISTENTAVSNGQYVSFSVKYQIDYGSIHEDDYITVTIPDSLKNLDLQLDPRHFKGHEKQADGRYRLIFNDNADGIAGSFSLNATASNETTSAITATVDVNGAKSSITISGLTPSGAGVKKAIEKSAYDGASIQYGGYDYSTGTGQDATEIGIYTPSADVRANFHIDVNHNGQEMWNVTVTDDIPVMDGVLYNNDLRFENLNGASYTDQSIGNRIKVYFHYLSAAQEPRLTYSVTIKAGTRLKISNNAVLDYTSDAGENETVIDRFQLKPGNGYSAADAYKSVDKTVISADPADQTVKYTITFDPDKEFAAGELRLEDQLNEHVRYLYAYGDSAYDVSYDVATHTVHMVNNRPVEGNQKKTVTIVTDFSAVPEGTDVANTVGNTVHTLKYKGELALGARKTVDGAAPGAAAFSFRLLDGQGQTLQTKQNDAQGQVVFDRIYYGKDDLGREHRYTVMESSDLAGYARDEAVYAVAVTPKDEDGDGILEIVPEISKDGQPVQSIVFDNKRLLGRLEIRKAVLGALNLGALSEAQKQAIRYEITGPDSYSKTIALADMADGVLTLSDLVPGRYTVREINAQLPGYTLQTVYSPDGGAVDVEAGKTARIEIANTYTPTTPAPYGVAFSKVAAGQGNELAGAEISVRMIGKNGAETLVQHWTSDGTAKVLRLVAGEYKMIEDQAPLGYSVAAAIEFRVNPDGTVDVKDENGVYVPAGEAKITMVDELKPNGVTFSKVAAGQGGELPGAKLTVKKADGTVADTWTSTGTAKVLHLTAGEYTMIEDQAPLGYLVAEKITFRVKLDGTVEVKQGSVWVSAANATVQMVDKPEPQPTPPTPSYATLKVPLTAHKTYRNGKLTAGQFTFLLKNSKGELVAEATNDANGNIVFPERTFSREVTNYTYTIEEQAGSSKGVTYDRTVYTVRVTTRAVGGKLTARVDLLKDKTPYDGAIEFVNERKLPKTGDARLLPPLYLALLSLLMLGGAALLRRKQGHRR